MYQINDLLMKASLFTRQPDYIGVFHNYNHFPITLVRIYHHWKKRQLYCLVLNIIELNSNQIGKTMTLYIQH